MGNHHLIIVFYKIHHCSGRFFRGAFLFRQCGSKGIMTKSNYDSFLSHKNLPSFLYDETPIRTDSRLAFSFFRIDSCKKNSCLFYHILRYFKRKKSSFCFFPAFCSQPYCKEMHGGGNPAFCYWACVFFFPSLAVTFCSCHSPF